jgi:hypothetical protein
MSRPSDRERRPGGKGRRPQSSTHELALQRNPVHELLDSLVGIEVDGGCPDCPAYQTIERVADGIYVNRIFHDDTCPWWIRYQAATP